MSTLLRNLLLSSDPIQQVRLKVWATAAVGFVLFSLVQVVEVWFGLLDRTMSNALIAAMAGSALFFYALFRTRTNLRFRDPGLTLPQLVIGVGLSLWSYAVTGPARGAILLILVSTLMYGMFSLTARQSRGLAASALVALAGVMVWRSRTDPAGYPWRLEVVHFLFASIVMWTMASLSEHLGALRAKLGRQAKELKQAMEQLKQLATRDELTQIHNRRHMSELMGIEARQHERSGAPMCIALLDIDLFKSINDRHGHAAGDKVLQHFARAAQEVLRSSDLLCRWGGEEFLVLFPDTPVDLAHIALERLHQRLADEEIAGLAPGQRLSFSAGLTAWVAGEPIEATTERADQAMYGAKTGGRKRTSVVFSPTAPLPEHARELVGISLSTKHPALAQHWQ